MKHWILPKQDILKGTRWALRPLGNSPEFNPLDCNLNRDLHSNAMIEITIILSKQSKIITHTNDFISTTKQKDMEQLYKNVWKVNPCSTRILHDIKKIPLHFKEVYENDGCIVKGIGQNKGIRYRRKIEVWNEKVKNKKNNNVNNKSCMERNTLKKMSPLASRCLDEIIQYTERKVNKEIKQKNLMVNTNLCDNFLCEDVGENNIEEDQLHAALL